MPACPPITTLFPKVALPAMRREVDSNLKKVDAALTVKLDDHEDKIAWHFIAPNVHDFSWAADPDFVHDFIDIDNGPRMHFFYKRSSDYAPL